MNTERIAFLFGAGLSLPAGMPSTQDITDAVLSGEGVARHPAGIYGYWPTWNGGPRDEEVLKVLSFLKHLENEVRGYYSLYRLSDRKVSYEDLYSLANQIHRSEMYDYDNPALNSLIRSIPEDMIPAGPALGYTEDGGLWELSEETENYIHDVTWRKLETIPKQTAYLNWLRDGLNDTNIKQIEMFTLNHDLLIENCLRADGVKYTDGFAEPHNSKNIRDWDPHLYDMGKHRIRLYKLHGSINWYQDRSSLRQVCINGWTDDHFARFSPPRPRMLLGTIRKLREYNSGMFMHLHLRMANTLQNVGRVIACGYSFRDEGINNRIYDWLFSESKRNRLIIIHGDVNNLKATSGFAAMLLNDEKNADRIRSVPKWAQDVAWQDVCNVL